MAEAAISWMIQDLESLHVTCTKCLDRLVTKSKIKELKEMLDFLRDLKLEEKSRLENLIADLIELAYNVIDVDLSSYALKHLQDKIKATKMRMINFGAGEENIGDKEEEAAEEVVVTKRSLNMAEAKVLGMIEDLKSCKNSSNNSMLECKVAELTHLLDFLKDFKVEERSRLEYFTADLVQLGQDVMDVEVVDSESKSTYEFLVDDINKTKIRMIKIGASEKNIGNDQEEEEEVVGLEQNVKQLLDRAILKIFDHLQIFLIKGMIGIGKTTLARQLYKAGASKFKCHAWVRISSDTTNREILMKLIKQMVVRYAKPDPSLEEMDNQSLLRMLHGHLRVNKSYFIVLDNMLEETDLKYILKGLPPRGDSDGSRSTLLLTSRCEITTTSVNYTHEMKALDSDKSWQLFLKTVDKITRDVNKFSKELERKGREMLKQCGGLPLAIRDVARQKAKQRLSGMEWEQLFDSVDLSESLKLLEPIYHELEDRVKPHFLYLSFFKENAIMREEKLEQIWAANGLHFVQATWIFAHRSVLEVVKQHYFKKRCRLNLLLHMISIKKAEEEMGLEILRSNANSRPSPSQNARHRIIRCGRDKFNHFTNEDSKKLMSLIFHGGGRYLDNASSPYWESFESLKILDMEDFGVKSLSEAIGVLVQLRYLGMRNNYIQEIPHSLVHLEKLEVLDIAQNFMVKVPNIIWPMGNLRDLHMSDVIFWKPLKVDVLRNLETLAYISIYDWTYEDPSFRMKLRMLGIEDVDENSDLGKLFESLAKFPNFDELSVRGFRFRSMPCLDEIGVIGRLKVLKLDGRIGRLPSADNLPQEIEYIALINTCLDEDPMPILEKLHSLSQLKLRNAYTGREMVIQQGGFPKLNALCINELWDLRKIQVGIYGMWNLRKLEINNCPHLETLPQRIRWLSKLQKFKMVTTKHIAADIRDSGFTNNTLEEEIHP